MESGDGSEMKARLLETVYKRLAENGGLDKIKCELRAMVINDVREGDKSPMNSSSTKVKKSPTDIANHLILEYLEWIGFQYSLDMFSTESGCTSMRAREHVESKIEAKKGYFDNDMPLLMSLTVNLLKQDDRKD